jgi:hypothetical protein
MRSTWALHVGVFDVFTYAAPGSLYLALMAYIATRLGWVDPLRLLHANATLTILAAAVASYLLGHTTYVVGQTLNVRISLWNRDMAYAREEFVRRVPAAAGRSFLKAHRSVLQAAVELQDAGAAVEITRLRAVGLMLRNSAPPLILGAVTAIVNAAIGDNPVFLSCCAIVLSLTAAGCLFRGARMSNWADMKTLELAFWVPDIDKSLTFATARSKASRKISVPTPNAVPLQTQGERTGPHPEPPHAP